MIGDWHIYQRRGGHRTSTDDLITAWYAVHRRPQTLTRYLDLGCGIGSVLLMVSHKLRPAEAVGVEAQPQSVLMARRAVEELPAHSSKIQLHQSDFRHFDWSAHPGFDLVTGSPPYFPLDTGVLPNDEQRRACRFEARGGVEAYFAAATAAMRDGARFYLVFQTKGLDRVVAAASAHALHLGGQADFLMRRDRALPFLSVFEFVQRPVAEPLRVVCCVREADGSNSDEYMQIRRELGVT